MYYFLLYSPAAAFLVQLGDIDQQSIHLANGLIREMNILNAFEWLIGGQVSFALCYLDSLTSFVLILSILCSGSKCWCHRRDRNQTGDETSKLCIEFENKESGVCHYVLRLLCS